MESIDIGPFRDYITPGKETYLTIKDGKIKKTAIKEEQAKFEEISSVFEKILPEIQKLPKLDIEIIHQAYSLLRQKEESLLSAESRIEFQEVFDKAQSHLQTLTQRVKKQEQYQNSLKEKLLAKGNTFLSKEELTENDIADLIELLKKDRQLIQKLKEMRIESKDLEEQYKMLLTLINTKGRVPFRSNLNKFWTEANQEIDRQIAKEGVDSQDLPFLLKIRAQIADYLDLIDSFETLLNLSSGAVRENLENLNQNKLTPLLEDVKKGIKTGEHRFAIKAAKEQSIAAAHASKALESLEKTKHPLEPTLEDVGVNPIFLLPEEEVVFKQPGPRSSAEDHLIYGAMNIKSQEAVVPMKVLKRPKVHQHGFTASQRWEMDRGYVMSHIDKVLQTKIVARLTPEDQRVWKAHYSKFKFGAKPPPLSLTKTDQLLFPYFVPNLDDPSHRSAFEKCEQWLYFDRATGNEQFFTFKQLHELVLTNKMNPNDVAPVVKTMADGSEITSPSLEELNIALNVPWKLVTPDIITKEGEVLGSVQAKPFIKDMILMKTAKDQPDFNTMMEHLTPDAEFNAVLTGELQFLDMFDRNLGIGPVSNAEYEKFKNVTFRIGNNPKEYSISELANLYLAKKINDDTTIVYEDVRQPLRNLDELKKALNISYKFYIFDTDLSFGEDNELQQISFRNEIGHHIPLRSCLLGIPFQNQPLSKECIEKLMNSEETDLRLQEWLKRSDAPILKRLTLKAKKELQEKLIPIQEKYSLSMARKFKEGNLEELNSSFSEEIVQINRYQEIWQLLEMRTILPEDTLEKIAKRNKTTIEELTRLNPSLSDPLNPGDKIRVTDELSSDTVDALEKRRRIAPQLFPRATIRQQNALKERQMRRTTYLKNYEALNKEFNNLEELQVQFGNFIKENGVTPLNSLRIEEYIKNFNAIFTSDQPPQEKLKLLNALCKVLIQEVQPTYFNLMKVMYPLLADSYELDRLSYGSEQVAGTNVGDFMRSIEKAIEHSNSLPRDPQRDKLASILADKLARKTNPSFHDYF